MRILGCTLVLWLCSFTVAKAAQVLPPTIVSPVTAVGQINTAFSYQFVATGDGPFAFSATGLPDGLGVSGDTIAGTPTEFGSFIVNLSATNLVGTDTETLTLDIQPLASPTGSLSNVDRDGDGFSDELEIALNSSPTKQTSKPFGGLVAASPDDIVIDRLVITFNFRSDRRDALACAGRMVVGDTAQPAGQMFVVDVGGVIQASSLDSRGRGFSIDDKSYTFSLTLPKSGATGLLRIGRFSLSIRKRSFFNQFTDEGLTQTTPGIYNIPVQVIFDGKIYSATVQEIYTVKANKTGRTKLGK